MSVWTGLAIRRSMERSPFSRKLTFAGESTKTSTGVIKYHAIWGEGCSRLPGGGEKQVTAFGPLTIERRRPENPWQTLMMGRPLTVKTRAISDFAWKLTHSVLSYGKMRTTSGLFLSPEGADCAARAIVSLLYSEGVKSRAYSTFSGQNQDATSFVYEKRASEYYSVTLMDPQKAREELKQLLTGRHASSVVHLIEEILNRVTTNEYEYIARRNIEMHVYTAKGPNEYPIEFNLTIDPKSAEIKELLIMVGLRKLAQV